MTMILSAEQRRFWFHNGYLVLPGFFAAARVEQQAKLHEQVWQELPEGLVVDHMDDHRRMHLRDVPSEQRGGRFKLNDLYLVFEETRQLSLDPRLVAILQDLQADKPVLCNTLDLDYGSAQQTHADSIYMTPVSPNGLIATWIALEDGHADSGPLEYYPGSHMIPPYIFSTGRRHAAPDEMEQWSRYMAQWIDKLSLSPQTFIAKKGDLFIWHAHLLHAGSKIKDAKRTRRSLVSHYYAATDCQLTAMPIVPLNGGYWNERPPQAIGPAPAPAAAPSALEHLVRTTVHYFRAWRREALAGF